MKKFIFIFILLSVFAGMSQAQTSNPFELIDEKGKNTTIQTSHQHRAESNTEKPVQAVPDRSTSDNPFDLNQDSQPEVPQSNDIEEQVNTETEEQNQNPLEIAQPVESAEEKDTNPFSLQSEAQTEAAPEIPSETKDITEEQIPPIKGEKKNHSNVFVFWISILSGLILSILLTINRSVIVKIWKGIKNNNFMILFQKEERNGTSISFGLLYLCYLLNLAAFVTLFVQIRDYQFLNQSFIKILLLVLGILLFRHVLMYVMRQISNAKKEINNYYFSIISINSLLGIVLIPVNLLLAFGPSSAQSQVVVLGILILLGCLILRWIKGIINSLRLIFNASFHFFLYLCTAEMLPLLIGIRIYLNLM